ncbi:hypothetical protein P280DRAFT_94240 [Massarina eburnea CBS 473.64]|uniref:Uncharacterized protein n=1 Tax=Massarina eburnea CBS 473.64 TaxID=1395130 RepID=A0A6A6RRI8_9PLEO|nr:hypothetical protein P280DRAFT_94240 [Massarina eburnea CBS 473.64]
MYVREIDAKIAHCMYIHDTTDMSRRESCRAVVNQPGPSVLPTVTMTVQLSRHGVPASTKLRYPQIGIQQALGTSETLRGLLSELAEKLRMLIFTYSRKMDTTCLRCIFLFRQLESALLSSLGHLPCMYRSRLFCIHSTPTLSQPRAKKWQKKWQKHTTAGIRQWSPT